jgi:acetyl-CoA acetyltransferase
MGGVLTPLTAAELATQVLQALVKRTRLGEGDVDDVILGSGYAGGQAPAIDRSRETAGGTNYPIVGGMIETAENVRREYGVGRDEQDEFSVQSRHRAVVAHDAGRFADEIIAVTCGQARGP